MIVAKFDHVVGKDKYHVLVHEMTPFEDHEQGVFATVYKNDEFYHKDKWTFTEKVLFDSLIFQAMHIEEK